MPQIKLTKKQTKALDLLDEYQEVVFGGGAGGAKSFLGCLDIIICANKYPGTRWLIGRAKWSQLKITTLVTFFEVLQKLGIDSSNYNYNGQDKELRFNNGSVVLFKDLFLYPADPNFDSLGSLEITGAFIDECNQVVFKAWDILGSRIRYKLKEFDIDGTRTNTLEVAEYNDDNIPVAWFRADKSITRGLEKRMLGTCNPSKNWVYNHFYKADRDGTIRSDRAFLQSLATDNPNLPEVYIESLKKLDKNSKERLLYGNWEYDDDPSRLMEYDKILDMWTNTHVEDGSKYITADIAGRGSDKFRVWVWSGFRVIHRYSEDKSTGAGIVDKINELKKDYSVPNSNIVYDADGIGGGISGFISNTNEFINNAKAKDGENYKSLKTQCAYKLAELVGEGGLYICDGDTSDKEEIIEEFEQLKRDKVDNDGKLEIIKKEVMKEKLNRSPDHLDNAIMRLFFEVGGKVETFNPDFF